MSHLQGTDYVGSMVVLEDGLPRPSEYRRFKVRDVAGNDDYAAMHEVLTRRFTALLKARAKRRPRRSHERMEKAPQVLVPPSIAPLGRWEGPVRRGSEGARESGAAQTRSP